MTFTIVETLKAIDGKIESGHYLKSHYWNTAKHYTTSFGIFQRKNFTIYWRYSNAKMYQAEV